PRIEVDRVVEEAIFQVLAGRLVDVLPALAEGGEPPVQPLSQVWNGSAQMAEHPPDAGKALDHAGDTRGAPASGVSNKNPTSGMSQYSVIASTPTGDVG